MIRFGPGGNCEWFKEAGNKTTDQMPAFLKEIGLSAYEVECGRGVRMNAAVAKNLRTEAARCGIALSVHAPYYISMSSLEEEKRNNSVQYLLESAVLARKIGADRVIFHPGSCAKISRGEALSLAVKTLKTARSAYDAEGFSEIVLCPETMGKINQLGSLEEVIALCETDERVLPAIDFGHLNAREQGLFYKESDYDSVLERVEDCLGAYRAAHFHAHFSKIAYTAGGEKCHLTFEDTVYGPDFAPLAAVLAKRGSEPVIICESAGTQSRDALTMKNLFDQAEKCANL